MEISSNRKYQILGFEVNQPLNIITSLNRLIDLKKYEETEVFYSLDYQIDKILDLKISESTYIFLNRDEKETSKAVILRIE